MDTFERQFPSLSEFGKQFEAEDFKPGANGLVGPFERVNLEDDEDIKLPDVPDFPDLPSVPDGLPSRSETLPPAPARPDKSELDDEASRALSPPRAVVDVPRPASTANVASLPEQESRSPPAALRTGKPSSGPTLPAPVFPEPKPAPPPPAQPDAAVPALPPKPKYPLSNAIDPETIRSYIINPSAQILLLDLRSEEEYKRGYVGKEYEPKGYNVAAMWLDPTVLMRSE
jgi:ubiquitin carboxyl-terminal hydrolase 8